MAGGGRGPAGAGGGGLGQRLVISGLPVSGAPVPHTSARPWFPSPPLPGAARVPPLSERQGGLGGALWVGGPWPAGGCPASLVLSPPPVPAAQDYCRRARSAPAPQRVWGPGLQRGGPPPAVLPVAEGSVQGLGEPVFGLRALQESRPRWLPVRPPVPNHGSEDPFVVILGHPPLQKHLLVPLVPLEEHGIERRVPHPPGGP